MIGVIFSPNSDGAYGRFRMRPSYSSFVPGIRSAVLQILSFRDRRASVYRIDLLLGM